MRLRPGTLARVLRALAIPVLVAVVATAAAPGVMRVRVHPGDTLWGIARAHHTTVGELRRLNHIPANSDLIFAGQLLRVPGNGVATRHHRSGTGGHRVAVTYVVRSGDTVTGIARRYHVDPRALIARNHLSASGLIVPGQRLTVLVRRHAHARHAQHAGPPAPSRDAARRLIAAAARRYGVDPALAMGLSYMESGFNQRAVSSTGALGIMQVMPSTGRWLATDVLHRPLNLRDARDNVTAGVYLLRLLTRAAPLRVAIAGYYQGLGSVRERGMLPETERYVANVLALRDRFRG